MNKVPEVESFGAGPYQSQSYAADRYRGVSPGWNSIFKRLLRELKHDNPSVILLDAQERSGALFVYVARGGLHSEELIAHAARESRTVCQLCGERGRLRQNRFGQFQVRCAVDGRGWSELPELPMFPAPRLRSKCDVPHCPMRSGV